MMKLKIEGFLMPQRVMMTKNQTTPVKNQYLYHSTQNELVIIIAIIMIQYKLK